MCFNIKIVDNLVFASSSPIKDHCHYQLLDLFWACSCIVGTGINSFNFFTSSYVHRFLVNCWVLLLLIYVCFIIHPFVIDYGILILVLLHNFLAIRLLLWSCFKTIMCTMDTIIIVFPINMHVSYRMFISVFYCVFRG